MASRGKKKTTMAKLTRESRLRERRVEKKLRKEARKNAPPGESEAYDPWGDADGAEGDDETAGVAAGGAEPSGLESDAPAAEE